jgi:hypothetical protein
MWLGPMLQNITAELVQLSVVIAELKVDTEAHYNAVLRRLPAPLVDSFAGLLRSRALAIAAVGTANAYPIGDQLEDRRRQ